MVLLEVFYDIVLFALVLCRFICSFILRICFVIIVVLDGELGGLVCFFEEFLGYRMSVDIVIAVVVCEV